MGLSSVSGIITAETNGITTSATNILVNEKFGAVPLNYRLLMSIALVMCITVLSMQTILSLVFWEIKMQGLLILLMKRAMPRTLIDAWKTPVMTMFWLRLVSRKLTQSKKYREDKIRSIETLAKAKRDNGEMKDWYKHACRGAREMSENPNGPPF